MALKGGPEVPKLSPWYQNGPKVVKMEAPMEGWGIGKEEKREGETERWRERGVWANRLPQ
jgi:hypothetical protein